MKKLKTATIVKIPDNPFTVTAQRIVCSIGSCFAQDVVSGLFKRDFSGAQNPTGIIYNSVSIDNAIEKSCGNTLYTKADFFEFNGQWHSWEHHGRFSDAELEAAIDKCNSSLIHFREKLKDSSLLIVTPSSSVVYVHDKTICANCHRVPNHQFERRLLSVEENVDALKRIVQSVRNFNPGCRIIFTLSPVRHYPGELTLNARSKAHLLTAIHACIEVNADICAYFPAYEILIDELRDYSFYADDLLHPNEKAKNIILERFAAFLLSPRSAPAAARRKLKRQ